MEHLIKSYGERLAALVAERGPLCVVSIRTPVCLQRGALRRMS